MCVFDLYAGRVCVSKRISSPLDDGHRRFSCVCVCVRSVYLEVRRQVVVTSFILCVRLPRHHDGIPHCSFGRSRSLVRARSARYNNDNNIKLCFVYTYCPSADSRCIVVVWNSDRDNYIVIIKLLPSSSNWRVNTRFLKKKIVLYKHY